LFGQQTVYQFVRLFLFFFYQTVTKLQTFWIPNKFDASRKYKPSVLQSVHSIYTCRRTWIFSLSPSQDMACHKPGPIGLLMRKSLDRTESRRAIRLTGEKQ